LMVPEIVPRVSCAELTAGTKAVTNSTVAIAATRKKRDISFLL
jgi:hypothetical protein